MIECKKLNTSPDECWACKAYNRQEGKDASKVLIPSVHTNGTGREGLVREHKAVYDGLTESLGAMQRARPNGRDYYVQGDQALTKAMIQDRARTAAVQAVADEYALILVHLRE